MVTAQDPYVDIDGSMNPPTHFGPWFNKSDAGSAKNHLEEQEQVGYSMGSKMKAYEDVEVYEVEVLHGFQESQVW